MAYSGTAHPAIIPSQRLGRQKLILMQCHVAPESSHERRRAPLTTPSPCPCYASIAAIPADPEGLESWALSDAVQARVSSGDRGDTSTRSLKSYGRGQLRLSGLSSCLASSLYLNVASFALLGTAMLAPFGKVAPENFHFGTMRDHFPRLEDDRTTCGRET
ncbi:unnamed protein product [Cercospora beticola]|nr:unnamed protein product [Cercospora beticola]